MSIALTHFLYISFFVFYQVEVAANKTAEVIRWPAGFATPDICHYKPKVSKRITCRSNSKYTHTYPVAFDTIHKRKQWIKEWARRTEGCFWRDDEKMTSPTGWGYHSCSPTRAACCVWYDGWTRHLSDQLHTFRSISIIVTHTHPY